MKMDSDNLKKKVIFLKEQLFDKKTKRNYIQIEKDMINEFYGNTKEESKEIEAAIKNYDTEIENQERDHHVELKVYDQKVKNLEYEHLLEISKVKQEAENDMKDEKTDSTNREKDKKKFKKDEQNELKTEDKKNVREIESLENKFERDYDALETKLKSQKKILIEKYEDKLKVLQKELELRLKVEIHEIEERKNQHINDLLKNHAEAFKKMKDYYNDITKQNLEHIKNNKIDLAERKNRILAGSEMIKKLMEQNALLVEPKMRAEEEVKKLNKELSSYPKDKMSLKNAKARLKVLKENYVKLNQEVEDLNTKYKKVDKEKNDMYSKFENAIEVLRRKSDYKNVILENKLEALNDELKKKETQLNEVISRSSLDPKYVDEILKKVEEAIEAKNSILRNLKYSLAHAQKAYNDAIRVYEAKLIEFGIPMEELGLELLETNTSNMPAGLVAA